MQHVFFYFLSLRMYTNADVKRSFVCSFKSENVVEGEDTCGVDLVPVWFLLRRRLK